jgi:hypothetical protein
MNFILRRNIEKLRAFVALMRRWFGFVLLWTARLPIKRSRHELIRMEDRLRYLICASALVDGFAPGRHRIGIHRGARGYKGAWINFLLRIALPNRSAFGFDRLARIRHVAARIDYYIKRFMKRIARGLLLRRSTKRGATAITLISHAPTCVPAFADTS